MSLRKLLRALAIALLIVPAFSAATYVGGDYGRAWLTNSGNKNPVPQTTSLWDWGTIPKGQILSNGTLTPIGNVTVIYPAFMTSPNPIVLNRTSEIETYSNLSAPNINNPYLQGDPWFIAQATGQPVVLRELFY